MTRVQVQSYNTDKPIVVEVGATVGATFGVNLYIVENGESRLLTSADLLNLLGVDATTEEGAVVLWNLIYGVPPNLVAIAALDLAENTFIARDSTDPLAAMPISDFALSLVAAADRAAAVAVLDIAADEVSYDNTASGLTATDVQDAIDEIAGGIGVASVNGRTGAVTLTAADTPATVTTDSTTARSLVATDAGLYLRFTNAAAKTLTVQDNADAAITVGVEVHGRNAGAGDLTIVEDTSVTVNPPAGGTLVIPEGGTFTLKKVGTDDWDLFGVTVAV